MSQALIRKSENVIGQILLLYSYSAGAECGWSFNIVEITNAAHDYRLLYVFKRQGNV